MALSLGILHLRSALYVLPDVPARNHTGPFCPSPQYLPVSSIRGFLSLGTDIAQFHHMAVHSSHDLSNGRSSNPYIVVTVELLFVILSSLRGHNMSFRP